MIYRSRCHVILATITASLLFMSTQARADREKVALRLFDLFCVSTKLDRLAFERLAKTSKTKPMKQNEMKKLGRYIDAAYFTSTGKHKYMLTHGREPAPSGFVGRRCSVIARGFDRPAARSVIEANYQIGRTFTKKQGQTTMYLYMFDLKGAKPGRHAMSLQFSKSSRSNVAVWTLYERR